MKFYHLEWEAKKEKMYSYGEGERHLFNYTAKIFILLYQNMPKGTTDYPSFLQKVHFGYLIYVPIYLSTYFSTYPPIYLSEIPEGRVKVLPPSLNTIFLMRSKTTETLLGKFHDLSRTYVY